MWSQDDFKKLMITKKFSDFFGTKQFNTNLKLTRELVVARYSVAWKEWNTLITRLDGMHTSGVAQERGAGKAEDNLSAWLAGLHVDGEDEDPHHCTHPNINTNTVSLYHCSYCNNPSAVLRKCGGCSKTRCVTIFGRANDPANHELTRYCDANCQKMHWSEHKVACKSAQ